ncbi:DUF3015 domain-containing protein [Lujinxingia vulgaris]|uniref:DUF3015 domain-containing protein n=2 Tax=Lujinxingia vulgaris TaxID=2600176 RepID=A0A5C6X5S8_9DELT|nr:DUF3015 domain-containing protein [Lujinxingia vulgaris]
MPPGRFMMRLLRARSATYVMMVGMVALSLALPSVASADHGHSSTTTSVIFFPGPFMTLTSSTSTVSAAFFAPMFTTVKLFADNGEASDVMVAFLDDHQRDLQQDLALGGGAAIDALAAMMEIPSENRQAFSRALFEQRTSLQEALSGERVGVEEATRFLSTLSDAGVVAGA